MQADHRVSGEGGRAEISICFFVSGCSNFRVWAWSLIPPDFSVRSKPYLMSPFMGIPKIRKLNTNLMGAACFGEYA